MKIKILIPIYNDWKSAFKLLENINSIVLSLKHDFSVAIVNDGSTETRPEISKNLNNIKSVKVLNMNKNQGHARCNATGLKYIFEKEEFDYVIPMDGDGEDRPEEIKQLVDNLDYNSNKPVVGERIKRSEGIIFRLCYFLHKIISYTFTGESIKFGNYTCLPKSVVKKMVSEKATWSSFSGSLAKVANDRIAIPSERGIRYFGPSKMSFKNLIIHSLSIISVFKTKVLVRSFFFSIIYLFAINPNISLITIIPILLVIILIFATFIVSAREKLNELNNSLSNISNIDKFF